jgi:hypothetical protein
MYSRISIKDQLDPADQELIMPQYCLDLGRSTACQRVGVLLDLPQRFVDIKHHLSPVIVQYKTLGVGYIESLKYQACWQLQLLVEKVPRFVY